MSGLTCKKGEEGKSVKFDAFREGGRRKKNQSLEEEKKFGGGDKMCFTFPTPFRPTYILHDVDAVALI